MTVADRIKELSRPTGEEDLLDVRYPRPRFAIDARSGLILLGIVALGVLVFVACQREPPPVTGPNPYALATAGTATKSPQPNTDGSIVVYVAGAVAQPQLVTLAPGARMADALAAAVPAPDADLKAINQAQKLNDGAHIVVPKVGEVPAGAVVSGNVAQIAGSAAPAGGSSPQAGAGSGKVSINTADAKALEALPGVGPKTAEAIIAHREKIGGFGSVEQLKEVKGIGPAKFDKLKDHATL